MNSKQWFKLAGIGLGIIGVVVSLTLVKRLGFPGIVGAGAGNMLDNELVKKFKKLGVPKKRVVKKIKRHTLLVEKKQNKSLFLWRLMKPGRGYTQIELQEISHVPYRSVRRYVESLLVAKKIKAVGYGKGRRFSKVT